MDPSGRLASEVESSTGVLVLPHSTKKPGCGPEIMEYFRKYPETGVTRPEQVAVVGDRVTTDVMMANLMGGYAVWVKDGVAPPEKSSIVSTNYNLQALATNSLVVCAYGAWICGVSHPKGL
jgi:phosphatidylglycerophosphatase GEP4